MTSQTGAGRCAAQFYCAGAFEMTCHSEWTSLTGSRGAQLSSGIRNENTRHDFPSGGREARSAVLLRRGIRNDFPFGMDYSNREPRGAQRSSGIQDETKSQNKLPFEMTSQMRAERRAAQIYCAEPFEMTFPSEWISLNGG